MSPSRPIRRRVPTRAADDFDAAAANAANNEMAHTLQRNALRRTARAHGLELRHSDYGYALVDVARRRVDSRNDLTLDEVAAHLATASQAADRG
jgi:hypothetical protein